MRKKIFLATCCLVLGIASLTSCHNTGIKNDSAENTESTNSEISDKSISTVLPPISPLSIAPPPNKYTLIIYVYHTLIFYVCQAAAVTSLYKLFILNLFRHFFTTAIKPSFYNQLFLLLNIKSIYKKRPFKADFSLSRVLKVLY